MSAERPHAVLCVAGEASGDALLAPVVSALGAAGVRCFGSGGDLAAKAGLALTAHVRSFQAHGLVEALPALPAVVRTYRRLVADLPDADVVLLVDAPELNLRLLARAKAAGLPVVWLAPPQIWAWRAGRALAVARADALLCTMPFECEAYRTLGLTATFVGHPLADAPFAPIPVDTHGLAILPGSRRGTADRLRAPMLEAASRLHAAGLIDAVHLGHAPTLPTTAAPRGGGARQAIPVVRHAGASAALNASAAAIAAFGTVTLEAALSGRPLVTVGRLHPVTAAVAQRLVRVPHLALPNLILGERRIPECWQARATPDALAAAVEAILRPGLDMARAAAESTARDLRRSLRIAGPPFGERVAAQVLAVL